MYTTILNQLESELNEAKRQKRNDLNNYVYSTSDYYDNQILAIEKNIEKVKAKLNEKR